MEKNKLLPCPFCSGAPYLAHNCYGQNYVRCPDCGACVFGKDADDFDEKEAVGAWNRRACIERLDNERKKCGGKWHTDRYWLGWTDAMRKAKRIIDGTVDDEPMFAPSLVKDDMIPNSIPDSAWTDKVPDGVVHGSFGSFKNPASK